MNKFGLKTTIRSLKRIFSNFEGKKTGYFIGLIISSIGGDLAFNALFAFSFILLFGAGEAKDITKLWRGIAFLSIGFLATMALFILGTLLFEISHAKGSGKLREKLFSHIIKMPAKWFENNHSAEAVSRLTNDMQSLEDSWGNPFLVIISSIISGFGSAFIIFLIDYRFALVIVPFCIVMFNISSRFISPVKKKSDEFQKEHAYFTQEIVDMIASLKVIRIFNISGWLIEKLDKSISRLYGIGMKRASWTVAQSTSNNFASMLNFIGLMAVGSYFVFKGWFNFSVLIAMIQMGNGISNMFWNMASRITNLQTHLAGADRALDILDYPIEKHSNMSFNECDDIYAIHAENLSFSYDGSIDVIKNLNFKIKRGETIALVGESGGGKSTLLKLINGIYLAKEGSLRIFGVEINEDSKEFARDKAAYVPQTNYLFSGNIKDNIQYGKTEASEEEIIEASKIAFAHEFIEKMPKGYETDTGERGDLISGGQKQRIAIARAIIKNPPLLLLDEATSSLDTKSESIIQKAIESVIRDKTSIIIAHRLSTIIHADRILVLENGNIVEEGNHESLLKLNKRYAYYYNLQFR